MKTNKILSASLIGLMFTSCVIRPGEVGVKQSLGVLATEVKSQGTVLQSFIGK
jgi:hypothetical protein